MRSEEAENLYDALYLDDEEATKHFLELGQVDYPCIDGEPAWFYALACDQLDKFKLCIEYKRVQDIDAFFQESVIDVVRSRFDDGLDSYDFLAATIAKFERDELREVLAKQSKASKKGGRL